MNKGKYIIGLALDDIDNRRLEAILFSDGMTHKHAAELFQFGEDVVSAGFFQLSYEQPKDLSGDGSVSTAGHITAHVHGESESLRIGPQAFDEYYVRKALGVRQRGEPRDRITDYKAGVEIVQENRRKAEVRSKRSPMSGYRGR